MIFLIISSLSIYADENCTSYDSLGCYDGHAYWYDSCGDPEYVNQYCNWNEECIDGECINLCGNGICEADENEDCSNCIADCGCNDYEQCSWGVCKTYCGNGRCESDENCWKCNSDCLCDDEEKCEYPGICKTYCGNGKCDSDENCQICYDCSCESNEECKASSPRADSRGCVNKCGNGMINGGETCQNCPEDAGCSEGLYCYNNGCVECFKDIHCESKEISTGEFICSSDSRSTLEKTMKIEGVCENTYCTGERIESTKIDKQCGDKLCQEGECGCKPDYAACLESGKCEKQSSLKDGQSCSCYFQCESNYCNNDHRCVKALNAILTVNNELIHVGSTAKATISADNALDYDIPTKITLNIDSGMIMSGIIGGSDCSGNQCTGGLITITSKGRDSIMIDLIAQSAGKHTLTATITPTIDGQQYPKEEKIEITIINPDDGICSEGENSQNACSDCGCPSTTSIYEYVCKSDERCKKSIKKQFYAIFFAIVGLIALMIFSIPRAKGYYLKITAEREKRRAIHEEKELKERKKIVTALYRIKKKINLDNPIPVEKVISKAKLHRADPELVHEEYIQMLEKMKQVAAMGVKTSKKAVDAVKVMLQRFCTGCGAQLREGAKFCTKCGRHLKK